MWIPRPAVCNERRMMNDFGACDDWRSLVERRLVALQYTLNDQGAVVDSSGNVIVAADDDTGTGQTPSELAALGYTPDQIAGLTGSVAPNVSGAPGATAIASGGTAGGASSSSWVSGIGSLFGSLTNFTRSLTNPNINPATGLPYGVNPITGQKIAINPVTGLPYTQSQSSIGTLLVIGVVLWLVFSALRSPR